MLLTRTMELDRMSLKETQKKKSEESAKENQFYKIEFYRLYYCDYICVHHESVCI